MAAKAKAEKTSQSAVSLVRKELSIIQSHTHQTVIRKGFYIVLSTLTYVFQLTFNDFVPTYDVTIVTAKDFLLFLVNNYLPWFLIQYTLWEI
jgi:hypothetical protein